MEVEASEPAERWKVSRDRREGVWGRASIHPSIHPTVGQLGPMLSSGRHRAEHVAALPSARSSCI